MIEQFPMPEIQQQEMEEDEPKIESVRDENEEQPLAVEYKEELFPAEQPHYVRNENQFFITENELLQQR